MGSFTRGQVVGGVVAIAAIATVAIWGSLAPASKAKEPLSPAGKHAHASAVLDAMEGFRKRIPPPEGPAERQGRSVAGLGDYTMPHLAGVAGRLGVSMRTECLLLMTYLEDKDAELRLIALEAINKASDGWSLECLSGTASEGHRKMLFRFLQVIGKLSI